jgi:hypothetical protein
MHAAETGPQVVQAYQGAAQEGSNACSHEGDLGSSFSPHRLSEGVIEAEFDQ